jgi:hypothetical protein
MSRAFPVGFSGWKTMGCYHGRFWHVQWLPSGKHTKNYGKSTHFSWENSLFLWPFSIAKLNYQRVTWRDWRTLGGVIIYPKLMTAMGFELLVEPTGIRIFRIWHDKKSGRGGSHETMLHHGTIWVWSQDTLQ